MGKSSEVKSVIQKAINETAKETKERLYKETRSDYTIKASNFKKSDVKKTSATKSRLEATIQVTGRMLWGKSLQNQKKREAERCAGESPYEQRDEGTDPGIRWQNV